MAVSLRRDMFDKPVQFNYAAAESGRGLACEIRRVSIVSALLVLIASADFPLIDDGHHHGVDGLLVCGRGLPALEPLA